MHSTKTGTQPIHVGEALIELIWPTRCAGCEKPGELLCADCLDRLQQIDARYACPNCGAPFGWLVCTECYSAEGKEQHAFTGAVLPVEMDELSGRIIVLYKDNNEHRLSQNLAALIYQRLPQSWLAWINIITWIPADKRALRRRGFDHMEKMALVLTELTGLENRKLLRKHTVRDQRGLSRVERAANLQNSFALNTADSLPPHILLLDDVLTTGATLDAAASKLLEAGAEEVRVACFARVW